ncbi:MAG TPA: anti-sigma factor [Ilumatobacteraceae bacterium]|nr:anti-sigma factor [Ilumatobacteraceae bacterium]
MDSVDDDGTLDPEIVALLGDPSLWEEPSADLENRVVADIAAERRVVVPLRSPRRRWPGQLVAAAVGAAAAALIVVAVRDNDSRRADAEVALGGTDLAPGVAGKAEITSLSSGIRIDLAVPGLPRRDGEEFYQGWLKNCAGDALVPIGTFHDLSEATGWAGVSSADFPLLTITREVVAPPKDAAQGSSGEVVVSGSIAACPG